MLAGRDLTFRDGQSCLVLSDAGLRDQAIGESAASDLASPKLKSAFVLSDIALGNRAVLQGASDFGGRNVGDLGVSDSEVGQFGGRDRSVLDTGRLLLQQEESSDVPRVGFSGPP